MRRDLQSLRREAQRLRQKAGTPIPLETLEHLGSAALGFIIQDARKSIRADAHEADRQANPPTLSDFLGEDLMPDELPPGQQAIGPVLDIDELLQLDDSPHILK